MPILKSGRAVSISAKNFIDKVVFDENGEIEEITFGYRPKVSTTDDLLSILPIYYYNTENGKVKFETQYDSGYKFNDVVSGKAGWTESEIEEFTSWSASNSELHKWLAENLAAIKQQEREDRESEE
jgi:hypothetical protein